MYYALHITWIQVVKVHILTPNNPRQKSKRLSNPIMNGFIFLRTDQATHFKNHDAFQIQLVSGLLFYVQTKQFPSKIKMPF